MTSLTHSQGSTTFAAYAWTYDAANRVTGFTNTQQAAEDATYGYDDAGQLTGVTYVNNTSANVSYGFDDNGNRNTGGFVVSAPGSTTGGNQVSTDGTYDYSYDNNGNLTKQVTIADNSEIDYSYDYRNRLTEVTNKDSLGRVTQVVDYVYDAFNRLVGRTQTNNTYTGTSTTSDTTTVVTGHFVYDGANMVLALDNTGAVTNRVLWGPAVDQVLAEEDSSGTVTWALTDNQNTVRDLAQYASGVTSIVDRRVYTAFGEPFSTPAVNFDFGYTGRYYDPATGLQWNINRWYNPSIQRWMGQDPAGLGPDANPYRYCGNSPTAATDPSGLDRVDAHEIGGVWQIFYVWERTGWKTWCTVGINRLITAREDPSGGKYLGYIDNANGFVHRHRQVSIARFSRDPRTSRGVL